MTTVNLIIFGIGNVGSTLIKQLVSAKKYLKNSQNIDLKTPIIANSRHVFFNNGLDDNWELEFKKFSKPYKISEVIDYARTNFKNVVVIDATASVEFVEHYPTFIERGFHIASANKIPNTLDFGFYLNIRKKLKENKKEFQYETNVGAGLPVIETVKNLQASGEKINKIRGVFSGSLSYIFNRFSEENVPFSSIVKEASKQGFTEPDAREDLSGKDVARKLLILAREIGFQLNIEDVEIENLVPSSLNAKTTISEFNDRISELDAPFQTKKENQKSEVLRYVGELNVETSKLNVALVSEKKSTPLGQLKHTDNLFEIYSENYAEQPLVIQGAGAGKEVTARGLFSDILKIAKSINS